jgi:hypothetical protein
LRDAELQVLFDMARFVEKQSIGERLRALGKAHLFRG